MNQKEKIMSNNGDIILIHNHPASTRPSGTDILTMWKEPKVSTSIIVGHDGSVFSLSNMNRKIPLDKIYEKAYNETVSNGYPKEMAKIIATNSLYETKAFKYIER